MGSSWKVAPKGLAYHVCQPGLGNAFSMLVAKLFNETNFSLHNVKLTALVGHPLLAKTITFHQKLPLATSLSHHSNFRIKFYYIASNRTFKLLLLLHHFQKSSSITCNQSHHKASHQQRQKRVLWTIHSRYQITLDIKSLSLSNHSRYQITLNFKSFLILNHLHFQIAFMHKNSLFCWNVYFHI